MTSSLFLNAFVYLAAGVVAVLLTKRLGLGSVLGYLAAGILIGPSLLGWVGRNGDDVLHVAEFGVVMMLFVIGLELAPSQLWRLRIPIFGLGGLQVVVTAAIAAFLGIFSTCPWRSSLSIGLILSLSSTAMVIQTLRERGWLGSHAGQSAFAVLLFQDLAVIPILALLPLLGANATDGTSVAEHGAHNARTWIEALPAWAHAVVVLGVVIAIVMAGRFVLGPAFRIVAKLHMRELFTSATLLLVLGITILMNEVGLSPALGTFLAGVVLANSEYRHELEANLEPFKGLLVGLFFVSVGAAMNLPLVAAHIHFIVLMLGALVGIKFVVLYGLSVVFRMRGGERLRFALSLAQGGEFAFVLLSYAADEQIITAETSALLVAVVALSMATTPLLLLVFEKLIEPRLHAATNAIDRPADAIDEHHPVIIAGFGRVGGILGRFLRANGVPATVLDWDSDHVSLLRKLGFKVFYGDASRSELLEAAGAARAKLLVIALDKPEKNREVVDTVKQQFPHLDIIVRARGRVDAFELINAGVSSVFRETFDSSLRMGVEVLTRLGRNVQQSERAAQLFRTYDERHLVELARIREEKDREFYLSEARRQIVTLEETLRADLAQAPDLDEDVL